MLLNTNKKNSDETCSTSDTPLSEVYICSTTYRGTFRFVNIKLIPLKTRMSKTTTLTNCVYPAWLPPGLEKREDIFHRESRGILLKILGR